MSSNIHLFLNPSIPPPQLHAFYAKNHICEAGYGEERAAAPRQHAGVVVAAYDGDHLIALARE